MPLTILAIGGTPPGNITAPLIVAEAVEELQHFDIAGKIVLLAPRWKSYGENSATRYAADIVQQLGGVGLLVKSLVEFQRLGPS